MTFYCTLRPLLIFLKYKTYAGSGGGTSEKDRGLLPAMLQTMEEWVCLQLLYRRKYRFFLSAR